MANLSVQFGVLLNLAIALPIKWDPAKSAEAMRGDWNDIAEGFRATTMVKTSFDLSRHYS